MSPSPEKLKETSIKLFKDLHDNKKRNEAQEEEYKRLLALHGQEIIANPELLKNKKEEKAAVYDVGQNVPQNNSNAKNDFNDIKMAYKQQFGREPEGNRLAFANQAEAVSFFNDQSKAGKSFDARCSNPDHRMYSDGKVFVQGTNKEVEAYKKNPKGYDVGEDGKLTKGKDPEETPSQRL